MHRLPTPEQIKFRQISTRQSKRQKGSKQDEQYEIAMSAQAEQNQAAQKKIQTKIDGLKSDIQKMTEDLVRKQRETDGQIKI